MRKLLLALAATLTFSFASATGFMDFKVSPQSTAPVVISAPSPGTVWNALVYFDVRAKTTDAVILAKFTTITFPILKGFTLDLDGFGGVAVNGGNAVTGIALTRSFAIAQTPAGPVELTVGFAGSTARPGEKGIGVGFIVGGSIRF